MASTLAKSPEEARAALAASWERERGTGPEK